MTAVPKIAPSWLPRLRRRHIDRALRKLMRGDVCSLCGSALRHNSRTAAGLDARGNVALAGECCRGRLGEVFARGLYSDRDYDFMSPRDDAPKVKNGSKPELNNEQIAAAIAAYQKIIADTDKTIETIERCSGKLPCRPPISTRDTAWKSDDRAWFEQHPGRSHRARMPLPGEAPGDEEIPAGYALIILVRQVEPGARIRAGFYLGTGLLPVPDNEAVVHALFEIAAQNEPAPPDGASFLALVRKYTARAAA